MGKKLDWGFGGLAIRSLDWENQMTSWGEPMEYPWSDDHWEVTDWLKHVYSTTWVNWVNCRINGKPFETYAGSYGPIGVILDFGAAGPASESVSSLCGFSSDGQLDRGYIRGAPDMRKVHSLAWTEAEAANIAAPLQWQQGDHEIVKSCGACSCKDETSPACQFQYDTFWQNPTAEPGAFAAYMESVHNIDEAKAQLQCAHFPDDYGGDSAQQVSQMLAAMIDRQVSNGYPYSELPLQYNDARAVKAFWVNADQTETANTQFFRRARQQCTWFHQRTKVPVQLVGLDFSDCEDPVKWEFDCSSEKFEDSNPWAIEVFSKVQSGMSSNQQDGYLCIDLPSGDKTNGKKVWLHDCLWQQENQEWYYKDGKIMLAADNSKCLEVPQDDQPEEGKQLEIWDCSDSPNQQWYLYSDYGAIIWNPEGKGVSGEYCIDAHPDSEAPVQLWKCNTGEVSNRYMNQRWYSGNFMLLPVN
jgi:hypothetical protein